MAEEQPEQPAPIDLENATLDADDLEACEKTEFTEEEAVAFKGVYQHFDNHFGKGDGNCTPALVKSMVKALGVQMKPDDEKTLAQMLIDCDENQDGSTQFPEFLVLIHMMQKINFCGMNDAAAQKVKEEEEERRQLEEREQRKAAEKAAHRASSVSFTNSLNPEELEKLAAAAEKGEATATGASKEVTAS